MSLAVKLSALLIVFGLAACAQQEEPPAPVIVDEPVFTGKP